jgi:hypothetical protein
MNKNILEEFGREFIEFVRDNAIFAFNSIVKGHMKDNQSKLLHDEISKNLDEKQLDLVRKLITNNVDEMLHQFLWMFEQSSKFKLYYEENGKLINLNELSDGLSGELYTEDGWIQKFSKYL